MFFPHPKRGKIKQKKNKLDEYSFYECGSKKIQEDLKLKFCRQVAILGPPGSGKTTLYGVLLYNYGGIQRDVLRYRASREPDVCP